MGGEYEDVCARALSEGVLDGALLGIGAAAVLVAMTWFLSAYMRRKAVRFARRIAYTAIGFVGFLICTSVVSYIRDVSDSAQVRQGAIPVILSVFYFCAA